MHLEHLLEPDDVALGLFEVVEESLLQLLVGRFLCHFGQGIHELLFGVVDVLKLVNEQVVKRLDVLRKQTHGTLHRGVIGADQRSGEVSVPQRLNMPPRKLSCRGVTGRRSPDPRRREQL